MTAFEGYPVELPEVDRHRQAIIVDDYLMSSGLGSRLVSREGRQRFIEQLDGDQFVDLLLKINGQIVDQPPTTELIVSHLNGVKDPGEDITTDATPAPEDKQRLLKSTLAAAQASPVEQFKALTLATGILGVHPFAAGNGRTARTVYLLLSQDYRPSDPRLYAALQTDGVDVVPFEMRLAAELVYRQLRLKNNTHHQPVTVAVELQPIVMPAIADRSQDIIMYTPANRPAHFTTEASLFGLMVSDRYLAEMIPPLLVRDYAHSPAVRASYGIHGSQKQFAVDRFFLNATSEDVANVYKIYKKITRQYAQSLVLTIAGLENTTEKRQIFINEAERVRIGTLPVLMHELAEKIITPDMERNARIAETRDRMK